MKLPGRIEAEHYDLGAEGVAYHGRGLQDTNHGVVLGFPEGRSGSSISEFKDFRSTNVVLRTGEWVNFTVQFAEDGYFSALFRTYGAPVRLVGCEPPQPNGPCRYWGTAVLRAEVDGVNSSGPVVISGPEYGDEHSLIHRFWATRGVHQIRLAAESVENLDPIGNTGWASEYTGGGGRALEPYASMSITVDSIRVLPAVTPFRSATFAGREPGFQDGQGSDARFGNPRSLLGELSSGDLVVVDTGNRAIRLVTRDGAVRTLAGFPKNPVRDGLGTNAGFGPIIQAAKDASGTVFVLERDSGQQDRVRQVDLNGAVTTLFSGNAEATFSDFSGQIFQQTVPLSHIQIGATGAPEVLGMFSHYEMVNWGPLFAVYGDVVRVVSFTIQGGRAQQDRFLPGGLPDQSIQDFGGGYFSKRSGVTENLFFKDSDGVVSEVTPGMNFSSIFRSADGTFFVADGGRLGGVGRLEPGTDLSRLSAFTRGFGTVAGVPTVLVPPGREIRIAAIPDRSTPDGSSRFNRFLGWTDGSSENPRILHISRDTFLEANFGVVFPEPNGVVLGSVRYLSSGRLEIDVVGNSNPYFYQVETSQDLQDWRVLSDGVVVNADGGRVVDGAVEARLPQTPVSFPAETHQQFLRVQLLDR